MNHKMIVIEGLDGTGKNTQTTLLCETLQARGIENRHISFPDYELPTSVFVKMYLAGEFGNSPLDVNPYTASTFYAVDRFASFKNKWEKDYFDGTLIVTDRYATSNLIYQLTKLPVEQWDEFIAWEEDFEYNKLGIPRPNQIIYLDLPPEISQGLLRKRYHGEDKRDIHEKDIEFLNLCRKSAQYVAEKQHWDVINCYDGADILPLEDIHAKIMLRIPM